jgi:hypothetical protein
MGIRDQEAGGIGSLFILNFHMASSLYFGTPEEYKKGDLHLKIVWIYRIKNKE